MSKIYTFNKKKLVNKDGKYIQVPKYLWGGLVPPEPPEPDIYPYLLAQRDPKRIKLLVDPNNSLYYTNTPQIVADTLSNTSLGTQAFKLSFDVHWSAITEGTIYLFNAPGLMECKASAGTLMFKFGWDETWYSLDKRYLKTGWNSVELSSNGEIITLRVNYYYTNLIDASKVFTKSILYEGFSSSKYIALKEAFGTYDNYDIIVPVQAKDNSTTQPIVARNNVDVCMYMQGSSNCLRIYPSGTVLSSNVMKNDSYYWTRCIWDGSRSTVYIAEDDHSKNPQDLPEVTDGFWTASAYATDNKFSGNSWHIGHNGGTNTYWHGVIDLGRALIRTNGSVFADGTVEGSFADKFTINTDLSRTEVEFKPPYPQLTVGQITTAMPWTKITNIQATIL